MKRLTEIELNNRFEVACIKLATSSITKKEAYRQLTIIMDKVKASLPEGNKLYNRVLAKLLQLNRVGIF